MMKNLAFYNNKNVNPLRGAMQGEKKTEDRYQLEAGEIIQLIFFLRLNLGRSKWHSGRNEVE